MATVLAGPSLFERRIIMPLDDYVGDEVVEIINPGWLRLTYWISIFANPGGAKTLTLKLNTKLPDLGDTRAPISSTGPTDFGGSATGTAVLSAGPGVIDAWVGPSISVAVGVALPRNIEFRVDQGGGADTWNFIAGVDAWRG